MQDFDYMVLSPAGTPDPALPIAASRAGALGVLNVEWHSGASKTLVILSKLGAAAHGRFGVLIGDDEDLLSAIMGRSFPGLNCIVLTALRSERLHQTVDLIHSHGLRVYSVARSVHEARMGEHAGVDAIVAKGHEAGGWIGDEGSFVLLQRCLGEISVPVWAYGGIGLHTAAACYVAGAAGVVLDSQFLLARESPLREEMKARVASMDGSETITVGGDLGAPVRIYSRPGIVPVAELRDVERVLTVAREKDHDTEQSWRAAVTERVDWRDGESHVLAVGQDASFAAGLATRFHTVGGILAGFREALEHHLRIARDQTPLAENAPLALSHGTRFPIVQGPMTRVSDRADFAAAVAEAGGLPFLALALMRGPEVAVLLEETKQLVGDRPWGVGILGFVPHELRIEQLEAVAACRPPYALIAGGRPDQAQALEDQGTATYLHVPSPALLRLYLKDGSRRFVFEGRECGGHVGPRTSFALWDTAVEILAHDLPTGADPSQYHVLFAGGIHDALSAAMVATLAAPLAERGICVGVLLGTAYLFTEEAVRCGAITPGFQDRAVSCRETVLLESGPGHATRCLPSPFAGDFRNEKRHLLTKDIPSEDIRNRLEELNIGRLRIAAKGTDRNPRYGEDPAAPKLISVSADEQWRRGMYMIGQVAALRNHVCTLADLHGDISTSSSGLLRLLPLPSREPEPAPPPADIAIIGLGTIVPGAGDVRTFWSNVLNKVDAVTEVPTTRWDWRQYYDPDPLAPDKVYARWGGFIEDVAFDPLAFGMPPNSLSSIEPFQLLGLLVAKAALEDAGYAQRPFPRQRTSVIFGAGGGGADLTVGYTVRSSLPMLFGESAPELARRLSERLPEWTEDSFPGMLMNVAAGRIANRLDLGGINMTVDAACASSLAAVCLAARDLQAGTSDMAVAGGLDAIQNPFAYLCFSKTQALSPKGRCRPFDAEADGIAISEGFAAVVMKRLADAERDGDRIYAVIRGVGAASDGRDRSLTAPRPEGQIRALRRAYAQARISPATLGLIEAHGTGTVAGDRAEIEALSSVFSDAGARPQNCAIGSVKSMIGHTKATAGVVGVIKSALALHHRVLPPTLGVTRPNPKANFSASPFYVNTETRPWIQDGSVHPRRAGVSAFGFGGTDFHLVLEEYTDGFLPERDAPLDEWPAELFVWRDQSRAALLRTIAELAGRLEKHADAPLADTASSLSRRDNTSGPGSSTLSIVAESTSDLLRKMGEAIELLGQGVARHHGGNGVHYSDQPLAGESAAVAFLFPGQGSQVVNMARELAVAFPIVREVFDRADHVLADRLPQPLSRYIFPPPSFSADEEERHQEALRATEIAQPALGATELAYLALLHSLGIQPGMVAGHSYGEFVALAAAGSLADDDLLRLSECRGRFIREGAMNESGSMAAVDAGREALSSLVTDPDLVLANFNAPLQTVVSGTRASVERALTWCHSQGLRARRLPVACAFHSPIVAPAQQRLSELLRATPMMPPSIPVYSNTTAAPYPSAPSEMIDLLSRHLIMPVEFVEQIRTMYEAGARVFVEVGPRSVLTGLTNRILEDRPHLCVSVDQPGRRHVTQLLHCLAAMAAEGVPVQTDRLFNGRSATHAAIAGHRTKRGRAEQHSAMWLVNGGRARPVAQAAADGIRPPLTVRVLNGDESVLAPATNGNLSAPIPQMHPQMLEGREEAHPPAAATEGAVEVWAADGGEASRQGAPAVPGNMPSGAVGVAARDLVTGHQRIMHHFLETQRNVMLGYLRVRGVPGSESSVDDGTNAACEPIALHGDDRVRVGSMTDATNGFVLQGLKGLTRRARADHDGALPGEGEIHRLLPRVELVPPSEPTGGLAAEGAIVIVDDETGVALNLAQRLTRRGHCVVRVVSHSDGSDGDGSTSDVIVGQLDDPEGVSRFLRAFAGRYGRAKALLQLAPLGREPGVDARRAVDRDLRALFLLAKGLRENLEEAAHEGGAVVLGATRLGGSFAIDCAPLQSLPSQGAIAGFLKSLAHEWPTVRVKAVDMPMVAVERAADWLASELLAADGIVEVGYAETGRSVFQLVSQPLQGRPATSPIDDDSVLLVTGGARGITAEAALALAQRYRPTLVLVGRTLPADESAYTMGVHEPGALKQAILRHQRENQGHVTLAEVEKEYRELVRQREVRRNLDRLRKTGATVEYHACDVRDAAAFSALIESVYAVHERIDGVLHGAGVIEDKLVRDKDVASFDRVVATKVAPAFTLAAKLHPETLRFLVFFSSVSGRFGNRGQADYAAASEVLNKLAEELDRSWPARVVSLNWGPWMATGMVSPEIERQFASRGVSLIPVEVGSQRLDDELRYGRKGEVEVVVAGGRAFEEGRNPGATQGAGNLALLTVNTTLSRRGAEGVEVLRTLDLESDLYLADHRLDGRPVLPFAVAMELMTEVAAAGWPGLQVVEVRQARLLSGITLQHSRQVLRVVATPRPSAAANAMDGDSTVVVDVAIWGRDENREHYRAVVGLRPPADVQACASDTPQIPRFLEGLEPFPTSVAEAYEQFLFHGPRFRGITAFEGISGQGGRTVLRFSSPSSCLRCPPGAIWLIDPILVDSALQAQLLWARLQWGITVLPAELAACRPYSCLSAGNGTSPLRDTFTEAVPARVIHEFRIRPETQAPLCHADHYFISEQGELLLEMRDMSAAGSKALNRLAGSNW